MSGSEGDSILDFSGFDNPTMIEIRTKGGQDIPSSEAVQSAPPPPES